MSKTTYKEHLQTLKDSNNTILEASCCTDGTAVITLIHGGRLKSDSCEVISCIKECDGHTLLLHILVEEEYGYGSIPLESELFGKRIGSLGIQRVINSLPTAYTDKATATKYLAQNPSQLVELLSGTLNTQKNIIEQQSKKLSIADWNLSCIYEESTSKVRKLMSLIFGKPLANGEYPDLKATKNKLDKE